MQKDGIKYSPLQQTFEYRDGIYGIPSEFNMDTVLIMGIVAATDDSIVNFKVYENDNGKECNMKIRWNKHSNEVIDAPSTPDLEGNEQTTNVQTLHECEKPAIPRIEFVSSAPKFSGIIIVHFYFTKFE